MIGLAILLSYLICGTVKRKWYQPWIANIFNFYLFGKECSHFIGSELQCISIIIHCRHHYLIQAWGGRTGRNPYVLKDAPRINKQELFATTYRSAIQMLFLLHFHWLYLPWFTPKILITLTIFWLHWFANLFTMFRRLVHLHW